MSNTLTGSNTQTAAKQNRAIRLIALDLDGTVFNDEKQITPRTLAALQAALDAGIIVAPATGRTGDGLPPEFLTLRGLRYAITSNGAVVYDYAQQRALTHLPFAADQILPIYDTVAPFGGLLSVFIDGHSQSDAAALEANLHIVPENLRPYFRRRGIVPDLRALIAAHPTMVEKFSIMYPDEPTQQAAWAAVSSRFTLEITSSLPRNMELNAPGVTKGRGLLALAAHLGIDPAETMACGDSGNDLAMLQTAGLGVAMGNATPEIKAAADCVTLDNNHDGVAAAIETYALPHNPPQL